MEEILQENMQSNVVINNKKATKWQRREEKDHVKEMQLEINSKSQNLLFTDRCLVDHAKASRQHKQITRDLHLYFPFKPYDC